VRLPGQPRRTERGGPRRRRDPPDKPEKLAKFRDAESLSFPLLSDPERKVLTEWGAFGEKSMYGKTVQGVIRSTFVVDEKGKIEVAQYNVKATGHVAKLRRDLAV
jgi:peroxiredoxin Q/BCP